MRFITRAYTLAAGRSAMLRRHAGAAGISKLRETIPRSGPFTLRWMSSETEAPPLTEENLKPLFQYTSGRWLWDEDKQFAARYTRFNPRELLRVAAECIEGEPSECTQIQKIPDGGNLNSTILRLTRKDGKSVIAKIPHSEAVVRNKRLAVSSEVAMMDIAKTFMIPAPKVYKYEATKENSVEAEYILMEDAESEDTMKLRTVWPYLSPVQRLHLAADLRAIDYAMSLMRFNKFGSIYYAKDKVPGAQPLDLDGYVKKMSDKLTERIKGRFTIGPLSDPNLLTAGKGLFEENGPWTSANHYLHSLSKLKSSQAAAKASDGEPSPFSDFLHEFEKAFRFLIPQHVKSEVVSPLVWHRHLDVDNIYIDREGKITKIIDWRNVWAGPAFLQTKLADALYQLPLPEPKEAEEPHPDIPEDINAWYEAVTKKQTHLYNLVSGIPALEVRRKVVSEVTAARPDYFVKFARALVELTSQWHKLKALSAPINIKEDDVERALDAFRDTQMHSMLNAQSMADSDFVKNGTMHSDGWVTHEAYEPLSILFKPFLDFDRKWRELNAMEGNPTKKQVAEIWRLFIEGLDELKEKGVGQDPQTAASHKALREVAVEELKKLEGTSVAQMKRDQQSR